jgi:CheY-like chemotaxis protein
MLSLILTEEEADVTDCPMNPEPPLPPSPPASPTSFRTPAASSLRILLVEDDPASQKLAAYVLQKRGHTVEIAADGRQALSLTQQKAYDVILMDVQLPGMDGLETTAAIRAQNGGRIRPPIIALTAHALPRDRQRCLAAGMDGYLTKPIVAGELLSFIENVAAQASAGGVQVVPPPPQPAKSADPPLAAVFDPKLALKRCFDNPGMLREMVQCFFEELEKLLPQMRAALGKSDFVELGRLGHRLKGTLVYLGAEPARAAAQKVESFERNGGQPAEAEEAIQALQQQCEVLKSVLTSQHS